VTARGGAPEPLIYRNRRRWAHQCGGHASHGSRSQIPFPARLGRPFQSKAWGSIPQIQSSAPSCADIGIALVLSIGRITRSSIRARLESSQVVESAGGPFQHAAREKLFRPSLDMPSHRRRPVAPYPAGHLRSPARSCTVMPRPPRPENQYPWTTAPPVALCSPMASGFI
jgi:hypothetical protein